MDEELESIIVDSLEEIFESIIKTFRDKIHLKPHEAAFIYRSGMTGLAYFLNKFGEEQEELHDDNKE